MKYFKGLLKGHSKNVKAKLTHLEIAAASEDKKAYLIALKLTYTYRVIALIIVLVASYLGIDILELISKFDISISNR